MRFDIPCTGEILLAPDDGSPDDLWVYADRGHLHVRLRGQDAILDWRDVRAGRLTDALRRPALVDGVTIPCAATRDPRPGRERVEGHLYVHGVAEGRVRVGIRREVLSRSGLGSAGGFGTWHGRSPRTEHGERIARLVDRVHPRCDDGRRWVELPAAAMHDLSDRIARFAAGRDRPAGDAAGPV